MIKTIFWAAGLIFSLIINEPFLWHANSLIKRGLIKEHDNLAYRKVSNWADFVMRSTHAKINVYGLENLPKDGAMLFVSNHQSNFDIPLLLSSIPVPKGFIAKKELEKVPFISKWMKQIKCLFMDRDDMKQSMQIIIEGIKLLKSGYSMVIFPEGTRSKGKGVGEFKSGSFKLATKAKVPIVPLTIDGTFKLFEGNDNKIAADTVNLYIHKPIYTDNLTKEEEISLHTVVRDIIVSKLPNA